MADTAGKTAPYADPALANTAPFWWYANSKAHAKVNPYARADADPYAHTAANADPDTATNADSDAKADPDSSPNPDSPSGQADSDAVSSQ